MATPNAADEDVREIMGAEFIIVSCAGADEDPEIMSLPNMKYTEGYDENYRRYYFTPLPQPTDFEAQESATDAPQGEEPTEVDDSIENMEFAVAEPISEPQNETEELG